MAEDRKIASDLERFIKDNDYLNPLEILVAIANGDFTKLQNIPEKMLVKFKENGISPTMRLSAAHCAAPFLHQKMPTMKIIENRYSIVDGLLTASQRYENFKKIHNGKPATIPGPSTH